MMLSLMLIVCAAVAVIQSDTLVAANSVSVAMSGFTSGADGVRVIGSGSSQTGSALAQVGDFNGDGIDDFVISASKMAVNSVGGAGMALLVLGRTGSWTEIDLTTVTSGATMMKVYGATASGYAGTSVGGAGDVNGDGRDDLLISVPLLSSGGLTRCGAVFVLFGNAGPYADVVLSGSFVASSIGYAVFGPHTDVYLGFRPTNTIGLQEDVNGDGFNDFVVSAADCIYLSRSSAGCVWIIYGSNASPANILLSSLQSSSGVLIAGGAAANDAAGGSIDAVGDFNNDGFPDLLIGATGLDPVVSGTQRSSAGAAYLLFGSSTLISRNPDLASFVTGATGVCFIGGATSWNVGEGVSGAGDVNGDGFADILFGASGANSFYGAAFVVFGTNVAYTADVDLLTFTAGAAGYAVLGSASFIRLGISISRAGDVNQDGFDDILCGSFPTNGRVSIIYGSSTVPTTNVTFGALDNAYSFIGTTGSQLGKAVYGGLDVSGDGIPDIVLGASTAALTPAAGGSARGNAGAAYVMMGPFILPTDQPTSAPSVQPSAQPSGQPTSQPFSEPTSQPSALPSSRPSGQPSSVPSVAPSSQPSSEPSSQPSRSPTVVPTTHPSAQPSSQPSRQPSAQPSSQPTVQPTLQPSAEPSAQPTSQPSSEPTSQPSSKPSVQPSGQPSSAPTVSAAPTAVPTDAPSGAAGTGSDGSSPGLSDGGIAGVVVGGVVFLILLIAAIVLAATYCCSQQGAGPTPAPTDGYEMTEVQEA